MSEEENKAVVRRLYQEVFNEGNLELADELISTDGINHAAPPDAPSGPEGLRRLVGMLRAAFPDDRHEIRDMVAEGDRVAVRIVHTGTHEGPFRGMPPTGRRFEQQQMHVLRLENGRIAEHWAVRDELGMMRQLGLLPEPGGAA
ncbi:MAG: ester cyclase [Rubrobacteraceae bacterium]